MKRFLLSLLMLAFLSPLALRADEIIVGTEESSTQVVPFRSANNYSYTQSIYLKDEVSQNGTAMTITKLAYKCASSGFTFTGDIKIYVGLTDMTTHTGAASDWLSNLTLVFSGTNIVVGDEEWETFTFDTPYEYNATSHS